MRDELEGNAWNPPEYEATLVTTCHRLRKVPIGQQIGLLWLVPLALSVVEREPMAEGDCYPGDLLAALQRNSRAGLLVPPQGATRAT